MNCPSRVDYDIRLDGYNQNPSPLAADATTRNDLNHRANSRAQRDRRIHPSSEEGLESMAQDRENSPASNGGNAAVAAAGDKGAAPATRKACAGSAAPSPRRRGAGGTPLGERALRILRAVKKVLWEYAKFVGPGFMVAVAYIDPGNYATDVAAGASYQYRLLFMILLSNIFAIFLQALCVKLGTVTGMNLAENCKAHLPPWLNYVLYFFAESAIIATDIAEVIGTAIALNVLFHVPLVVGCAISIVDVLIILLFYNPSGSMRALRAFEFFVMLLVLGVVISFCFQLSLVKNTSAGEVFRGYLPSRALVEGQGLFQACGILGATVMPHSLFLGSGIVQPRLREFDISNNTLTISDDSSVSDDEASFHKYRPSLAAIKSCMSYSIVEVAFSLFTFALFVNSAILIVAGSSLHNTPGADQADLFDIHDLLSHTLAPAAGTIFALALLLSGTSAGIVCTIAGQMVSEGQLNWTVKPWVRRLITRSISITPSIIIAGAVGRQGLSAALEGSQVALSVILPFVSAPLIYFTCRNKYMTVEVTRGEGAATGDRDAEVDGARAETGSTGTQGVKMRNHWITATAAVLIWGVIVVMNVALLVLVGLGVD